MVNDSEKFRGRDFGHFQNLCEMLKEMYSWPLCYKFTYGCQTVVEGQGHFA